MMPAISDAPTRRDLVVGSGALFAWTQLPRLARAQGRDPRFLAIVLRGALDGLAMVAPVGDPQWRELRGEDALTLDGASPGLHLDTLFALNPAMPSLHELYHHGHAIIVHVVATPYRDRSHFDGQDVLQTGATTPGALDTGWLNRAVVALGPEGSADAHAREGLAIGPVTPLIMRGPAPVLSWEAPKLAPASDETTLRLLDLYRHTDPLFAQALEERIGIAAIAHAGGIALAVVVGAHDQRDVFDGDDQDQCPYDQRQRAKHVFRRKRQPMLRIETLAESVDRARPDIPENNAECRERQPGESRSGRWPFSFFVAPRRRVSGGNDLGRRCGTAGWLRHTVLLN